MITKWLKRQQGYLYMDAIVAMFILAVALVAIAGMFMYATKVSASAAHYTAATNIARQQMELLKKRTAAEWSDPGLPNLIPWQGNPSELTVNKKKFAVKTISTPINSVDPNLIQIIVIVSWNELSGTQNIQLTTYFSKE